MTAINLAALLPYVLIVTFTPGPNNISCASMGLLHGYRRTLPYILGIMTGFVVVMLAAALISRTLYSLLPSLKTPLGYIGAAYILWLAYKTLRAGGQHVVGEATGLTFYHGVLLQALNVKAWIYGLTIYATFLAGITSSLLAVVISALLLAAVTTASTSTWAVAGMTIDRVLRNDRVRRGINVVLALLLVYTAAEMSGLL